MGEKAAFRYVPFLGISFFMEYAMKKYGSSNGFMLNIVKKNPKVKVIISNFGFNVVFVTLGSEMNKEIMFNHSDKFSKGHFLGIFLIKLYFLRRAIPTVRDFYIKWIKMEIRQNNNVSGFPF